MTRAQDQAHYVALSVGDGHVRVRPGRAPRKGGYGARADGIELAEQELDAYFGSVAASLGLHAGAWATDPPPEVVDALAIARKHDAAIQGAQAWRGLRAVVERVQAWGEREPAHCTVAELAFMPRRYPDNVAEFMARCGMHKSDGSHSEACGRRGSLAGLLTLSRRAEGDTPHRRVMGVEREALRIWARMKKRYPEAREHETAERMARQALTEYFAPLRREAEATLEAALTSYAAFRRGTVRRVERDEVRAAREVFR